MKVREHLVFTSAEIDAWLERQRREGRAAAVLSTCNRFEIYWCGADDLEPWFRDFAAARGIDPSAVLTRYDRFAAVRHLFAVAAGLDSQILGEAEILGQVRRAHRAAQTAGTCGPELDALFCGAISAGRRIRRETPLGRHPASVSSAAVEVALATSARGTSATALVLGGGEVADGVIRALVERGVGSIALVNRRPERATALAARWKVEAHPWEEWGRSLSRADLLFVTTAAKHPVVGAAELSAATATRTSELVVLDLAVPRNVEPAAQLLPSIRLFNLDDLQQLRCPAAEQPSIAVAEAERILTEELARLDASLRARAVAPKLAELHRIGAELAREETDRALASLDRLSDVERQVVREMAERLVRRVLYPVSRSLRGDDCEGDTGDGKRSA